jgi:hypothetical protein
MARTESRHRWLLEQSPMEIDRERRGSGAVQIEREREERTEVGKKARWRKR